MTFYDLYNDVTIQGDIRISVYDEDGYNIIHEEGFAMCDDISLHMEELKFDCNELNVKWMFCKNDVLHIELIADEDFVEKVTHKMTREEFLDKLRDALVDSYGDDHDEPIDDSKPIGLAYTEVYLDDEEETDSNESGSFDMQCELDLTGDKIVLLYYLNDEVVNREEYADYDDCYQCCLRYGDVFDTFYSDFIEKVRYAKGIHVS